MPQASGSTARAAAALALAVYALVLTAGPVLLHGIACCGHAASQCSVCACLNTVSSSVEHRASIERDGSDAGRVDAALPPCDGVRYTRAVGDRAPPAVS
jgi:hypothetical protein